MADSTPRPPLIATSIHQRLPLVNRRHALKWTSTVGLSAGMAAALHCQDVTFADEAPGTLAEKLSATAGMTEGPFYPDKLPLDTDNDLLVINDSITSAVGEITYLSGRVLSRSGRPVRNAFVEIWQVDRNGAYLHSGSGNGDKRDSNFQGYGRFLTDAEGRYHFRTIKPVAYPGRTPHIHVAVSKNGHRILTTQCFVKGEPQNDRDGLIKRLPNQNAKDSVIIDFQPIPDSDIGELKARFDIVLGKTAFEGDDGKLRGVGPRQWKRS